MFRRRLHMLFPENPEARSAANELFHMGLTRRHIHCIAQQECSLEGLPKASKAQRDDFSAALEHLLWNINLAIFFISLAIAIGALIAAAWHWAMAGLGVMLASFLLGNYFTSHIPRFHLSEYQAALRRGEILMLVDLPRWQVHGVESRIKAHHPEMELGGVSWSLDLLGY